MPLRLVLILSILALVAVPVANADTLIAPNLSAGASLTASGGSFTGTLEFDNLGSVSQGIVAFSLQLGNGQMTVDTIVFDTGLFPNWNVYTGKLSNNGSPCNQVNNPNWICADGFNSTATTFNLGVLPVGTTTLTFHGTYTGGIPLTTLDLMANGCSTTAYTFTAGTQSPVSCTDTKWAYSNFIGTPGGGGNQPPPVPEPASLMLLGTGLGVAAKFLRGRK